MFSQCRAGSSQVTEGVATHRTEGGRTSSQASWGTILNLLDCIVAAILFGDIPKEANLYKNQRNKPARSHQYTIKLEWYIGNWKKRKQSEHWICFDNRCWRWDRVSIVLLEFDDSSILLFSSWPLTKSVVTRWQKNKKHDRVWAWKQGYQTIALEKYPEEEAVDLLTPTLPCWLDGAELVDFLMVPDLF